MGRRESIIVGSTLLAICCLLGGAAHAMEPAQSATSSSSSVPAMPSFLAGERVPAFQEAWRASGQPSQEARSQQGEVIQFGAPAGGDPMAAARAAMKRARQPGRDDASVRRRAEELSRRFGAGSKTSVPAAEETPPSSAAMAPIVPAKESSGAERSGAVKQVSVPPEPPVRKQVVVKRSMTVTTGTLSQSQELQPFDALDASVRTQSAMTTERLQLAAPPPPSDAIPPLPQQAPTVRESAATSPPTTIVHTQPRRRSYAGRREPVDPMAALRGTVLTKELRSFGWNSQPK